MGFTIRIDEQDVGRAKAHTGDVIATDVTSDVDITVILGFSNPTQPIPICFPFILKLESSFSWFV